MRDYLDDTACKHAYINDPAFKSLVDHFVSYLHTNTISPGEARSIAVFACTRYELSRSKSIRAEDLQMNEREFRDFIDKTRQERDCG